MSPQWRRGRGQGACEIFVGNFGNFPFLSEKLKYMINRFLNFMYRISSIASEIQLKSSLFPSRIKAFYQKTMYAFGEKARSVVPKSIDFCAKIIFPAKKWFFWQKVQFLFKSGGTMCKNFERISSDQILLVNNS